MKIKYIITSALFVLSIAQPASAQDSTSTKKPSDADKIKAIEKAISVLPKISGLVNVRYQYSTDANNYQTGKKWI